MPTNDDMSFDSPERKNKYRKPINPFKTPKVNRLNINCPNQKEKYIQKKLLNRSKLISSSQSQN